MRTGIETAFITFFCTTAGKGDMSVTGIFVDACALWILTADKEDLWTGRGMLHPIIVEEVGERRRAGRCWRERQVRRRDDSDDEGYCGTTGLWRKKDGVRMGKSRRG